MPEPDTKIQRALAACGLWLLVGFIGANALAVGLMLLFDREAGALAASALALFGGMLAAASWRRGLAVLERVERAPGPSPHGPSARLPEAARARRDPHAFRYSAATRPGAR
jgi:hypothetical protein